MHTTRCLAPKGHATKGITIARTDILLLGNRMQDQSPTSSSENPDRLYNGSPVLMFINYVR